MNRCQRSNQPKFVYLLNSFPALSETFILQEILTLERQRLPLRLISLFEPSASEIKAVWNRQTPVNYISHYSMWHLLAIAVRCFLKIPGRFLRTAILAAIHYRPLYAIGYVLYAAYISEQLEQQGITHLHAHFATESTSVAQVAYMF